MRIFRLLAALLFTVLSLSVSRSAFADQPDNVRVAVLKGVESVRLGGECLAISDEHGRPLETSGPVTIRKEKYGIALNGTIAERLRASAAGIVLVNGKGYRNAVDIIPDGKGMLVVNELPLEDYLAGIINSEISSQWSMEAVKAQAVVARSYAVYQRDARKNSTYQLESTVLDQVYSGSDIEDSRAVRGVRETAGEVLTYDGKVIPAFFHSSCGGHTEASENVWSLGLPYLRGVDCKYCLSSPSVSWELNISLRKLEMLLKKGGYDVSGLRGIIPLSRNKSGRITAMSILSGRGSVNISAADFRKTIGYGVIRSTNFDVRVCGENAVFSGVGYGHGVGLCQWGAKKRAEEGFSYKEILSYYYPGTTLEKIY